METYERFRDDDVVFIGLTAGGHLQWVRPAVLLSTRCDPVARIQDFVFAGGDALQWNPVSEILYPEDEFCTKKPNRQEHRPVQAFFDLAYDAEEERTNEILERIDRLEEDLKALRELVTETEP